MLNYNPNIDWADQQKFDANGMPIPMGGYTNVQTDAVPKMMDSVHAANDIGQELKSAWLKGARKFMGGSGMLNSKKEPKKRQFSGNPTESIEQPKSEKPGYMMAEGTNFWTVNTDDPYWDTKEGYDEAIALYGESPAWSTMPVQPKQMLNNNRNTVDANLKKYF